VAAVRLAQCSGISCGRRAKEKVRWASKRAGMERWAVALPGRKNEKKSGIIDGLQGNTDQIEMGR
jgi:hypothetical protein